MLKVPEVGEILQSERDALYISSSEKTFSNDDNLPNLPIPPLSETLTKYLDSVRPHVSEEEYRNTESIVNTFEKNIGKDLHLKLLNRAFHQRNWLEKWWEDVAYLSSRLPLIPLCSMSGAGAIDEVVTLSPNSQVDRAALYVHFQLQFWTILKREQLRPHYSRNIPWSMNQFRRIFNTTRIPGEKLDHIKNMFRTDFEVEKGPSHLLVLHKGHIFIFDAVDDSEEVLSYPELRQQFLFIEKWCKSNAVGEGVACLTSSNRTTWARNRKRLQELHIENKQNLEMIESALISVTLDDKDAVNTTEVIKETFAGDCCNRWADKSLGNVVFKNGNLGFLSDHTPFDGLVPVVLGHFLQLSIKECNGKWQGPLSVTRELPLPLRLDFHLDNKMLAAIDLAKREYQILVDDVDCVCKSFTSYGKAFLRPYNIHPEAFAQMALQLAYYRMHGNPAPTYVTASTRQFYHGRTETLRSCFPEYLDWARTMNEDTVSISEKYKLLKVATEKFRKLMVDCTKNHGCDRHLMGLYLICVEEGLQVPEIFLEPSFIKSGGGGNFILSTSCCGYTSMCGCVMPMCENGYGAFYNIENNKFTFTISSHKRCLDTCAEKYFDHICQTMLDMQHLLTSAKL